MLDTGAVMLRDFWYLAGPATLVPPGRMVKKTLFGEPLLLARGRDGKVFALRDICPHRGIPLSYGRFDGQEVTCRYHGWRFNGEGRCTAIPSMTPEQDFDCGRIKVQDFPVAEQQGLIWIFCAAKGRDPAAALPPPPTAPGMGLGRAPAIVVSSAFPCNADHAAYGLMDPTHAAFVHTSWWWKKDATKLREKTKLFEPAPLGWRMKRHRLPPEHRIYALLGKQVFSEITYSLPGLRMEQIESEKHNVVGLTAITPLGESETEVYQIFWWTPRWLGPFKPLLRRFARVFLQQDRDVVVLQQEGLKHDPALLLVDDADTQAKWYFRIKREWLRSQDEGRAFENPVREKTLRWRS